ncbi:MAG TPA: porin [Gammaproteobacteria bacterium]|nr:porin [Gammaproteobacteria bacterium]
MTIKGEKPGAAMTIDGEKLGAAMTVNDERRLRLATTRANRRIRIDAAAGVVAALLLGGPAHGQPAGNEPAPAPRGKIDAGARGFAIASADGAWQLRLRGLVQLDGRFFSGDASAGTDEWLVRRVRPTFEGSFGERVGFRLMPDFGDGTSQIVDAYVDTKLAPHVHLRAGKFKPPVGLERLQSARDLPLVERSFTTELVPNRDIGLQLSGGERLGWAVGVFDGVVDGRSTDGDDDGEQELAARVFALPLGAESPAVLGIGLAVTYGDRAGAPSLPLLAGQRSPGQQTIFRYRTGADGTFADGDRIRVAPQLYWYRGPFGFMSEWVRVREDVSRSSGGVGRSATLENEAWQITGQWFVTGERAGYRDPQSRGGVELVARLTELSPDAGAFALGAASFADPASAVTRARSAALGVNWFPLPGIKASAAWHHTSFKGGAPAGDRPDEDVLLLRWQLDF